MSTGEETGSTTPEQLSRRELCAEARPHRWAMLAPVAIGLVAAALAWERLPHGTRRTLWAEDGPLFLLEALPGDCNLFAVYGGYLHVIPRLAALFVVHALDVRWFALGMNLSACLVAGLCASIVYVCTDDVIRSDVTRSWLALMTVLLPVVGVEVIANLANVHSLLMWACFWALVRHPRTLGGAVALGSFELLAALSEVQTVLLIPIGLYVLWRQRDYRQLLVVAGLSLGAASQMLATLTHSHQGGRQPHWIEPSLVAQLLGLEVAMPLWLLRTGDVRTLIQSHGWWVPAIVALPLVFGFALTLRFGSDTQRFTAFAAWALGLSIFCLSHMLNVAVMGGADYAVLDEAPVLIRYAVVPSLLFVSALSLGTASAWQVGERSFGLLGAAAMAALSLSALSNFHAEENLRDQRNSWTRQLPEARAACQDPGKLDHAFRVSPDPWFVPVPCSRLR